MEKSMMLQQRRDEELVEAKNKCAAGGMRAILGKYNKQVTRSCEIMLKYNERLRDFKHQRGHLLEGSYKVVGWI